MLRKIIIVCLFAMSIVIGCESVPEQKAAETTEAAVSQEPTATEQEEAPIAEQQTEETAQETETQEPDKAVTSEPAAPAEKEQSKPSSTTTPAQTAPKQSEPSQTNPTPVEPAPAQETEQKQEQATVTLLIQGDSQTGTIFKKAAVELEDGDTVFTVLARIVKKQGIQMEYTGRGATVYVQGIDNLYEFDRGPKSGWRFKLNGAYGTKSAGATSVQKGDRIEWTYTEDYSKDEQ